MTAGGARVGGLAPAGLFVRLPRREWVEHRHRSSSSVENMGTGSLSLRTPHGAVARPSLLFDDGRESGGRRRRCPQPLSQPYVSHPAHSDLPEGSLRRRSQRTTNETIHPVARQRGYLASRCGARPNRGGGARRPVRGASNIRLQLGYGPSGGAGGPLWSVIGVMRPSLRSRLGSGGSATAIADTRP